MFLRLWDQAATWSHVQRDDAVRRPDVIQAHIDDLLAYDNGVEAAQELLEGLLHTEDGTLERARGAILDAMQVLDEVYLLIHPRTALLSPSRARRRRLPAWLEDAREQRTLGQPYAVDDSRILAPRGPFTARARTMAHLNGETLEDRFNALTAPPRFVDANGRKIEISQKVIGHDAAQGVPAPRRGDRRPGSESVGVVVVAERADELEMSRPDRPSGPHLDIRARSDLNAADRFFAGVRRLGDLDVAMAPELTISEEQATRFAEKLTETADRWPRLSVAGSGGSRRSDERGRRENVSIMYNALGAELWRHRKVWPYAMTAGQVAKFRWDPIGAEELLGEDLLDGETLTVADLDGLGRVMILICQDFQINSAVGDMIRLYQPDWVLVPVLDSDTEFGRWAHKRAFDLSGLSNARFVVASSLALAEQAGSKAYPNIAVGLMVGPMDPTTPSSGSQRAVGTLLCQSHNPMCGKLTWGSDDPAWSQTNLAKPNPTS
ncbi:hypothetical protein U0030_02215 [Brevundimonas bullata]|uniref:hypothetical protein n=1 Tax=Brevundimonas bullata TaxID=13160 RepID=UPI0013B37FF5|nr:hypothetical protein [Brevundimonas bullata]WQE37316.1 hypothetical protein U0030_02215 [Brevundimonas bullata]